MSPDPLAQRVLVLAADPLARAGLVALLSREGMAVVEGDPDLLLWDLGLDGATPAPRSRADLPVLALVPGVDAARRALARGASGVLLRDAAPHRLVLSLRALAADLVVLDEGLAAALLPSPAAPLDRSLSPREEEVLLLMADGRSNAEIGRILDLSPHTARFHVRAILAKLEARNRAEAVSKAARLGLLDA